MPLRADGAKTGKWIAASLLIIAGGAGCGSSGATLIHSTGVTVPVSGQWKQVHYRDAVLDVPAAWPVIDLAKHPRQCAIFNVHAVYLGHQGADATCPARAIGRTEAVQVEPLDAQTRQQVIAPRADATINGEQVAIEPDGNATRSVVASFVGLGVTVNATYVSNAAIATHIVQSVQRDASASS
jgi:hypothetical protein